MWTVNPYGEIVEGEVLDAPDEDYGAAAQAIGAEVARHRLAPPPMIVQPVGHVDLSGAHVILGAEPEPTGLPIFDELHERFSRALPGPKVMRVDDEGSYARFRDARRARYFPAVVGASGDEVIDALSGALTGGRPVKLPGYPEGAVECWHDGPEVYCTVRALGPGRQLRMLTSATPVDKHVSEFVSASKRAGVAPETASVLGEDMVPVLGGTSLVPQICAAAPEMIGLEPPATVIATANSDPKIAATMALLQRAQQGDHQALSEVIALAKLDERTVGDARRKLKKAQEKRKPWWRRIFS